MITPKRIRKLIVNGRVFTVRWHAQRADASFRYRDPDLKISVLNIGTRDSELVFELVCHELFEIACIEHCCRYDRPDVGDDYLFNFNHQQYTALMATFAGLLQQFME